MIYKVVVPESVYLELQEVSEYYERRQPKLGIKFIQNWETAMSHLKVAPLLYQKKNKTLRTIKLSKFPYVIVFEIIGTKVYIYRITHAHKNPIKIYKK